MRRLGCLVLALICAATLTTGCSRVMGGHASSEFANPFRVGGLAATDGYSGLRPDAPEPVVAANGADGGTVDRVARQAVTDIETFWEHAYTGTFTGSFRQVNALLSWNAKEVSPQRFCGHLTYKVVNAAFCGANETIGWDRGVLLPALREVYGDMAITTVLAHEYGHAISAMARLNERGTATLISEQQADCLAGTYLRWVAQGDSPRFVLSTGAGLNDLLAVMIAIRDPLMTAGDELDGEHGSAFERISAFQFGFSEGAGACLAINAKQVDARRANLPTVLQRDETGEWPVTRESVETITGEMTALFTPAQPPHLEFDAAAASACPDARPSPPVSYCPATNTIAIDLPALQALGTPPQTGPPGSMADFIREALSLAGDNTAYSVLMSRYMLALQHERGDLRLDSPQAGLRTACLTGAATTAMAEKFTATAGSTLSLTAGDLDEAVTGLLTNGLVAADVNGDVLPAGFSRIDAFRSGVYGTIDRCIRRYP